MKKKIVAAVLVLIGCFSFFVWVVRRPDCSFFSKFNPDVSCRVVVSNEKREIVEFFNADTNEIRLYLTDGGKTTQIEHPFGKIENYSPKIDSNKIEFDPNDDDFLIVNGKKFKMTIVE